MGIRRPRRDDGPYDFGPADKLRQYAWFADNADQKTHPVGQKKPNRWGLYDMYGNVSRMVRGRLRARPITRTARRPIRTGRRVPGKDVKRVLRGGKWKSSAADVPRDRPRRASAPATRDACFRHRLLRLPLRAAGRAEELKNSGKTRNTEAIHQLSRRIAPCSSTPGHSCFLLVVLPVFFLLRKTRFWIPWLMLASYFFYGWWNPYYLLLVLYSTVLDYFLVTLMDHCPRRRTKVDVAGAG